MINVKSGGRTRIAGIAAAIFLLIYIFINILALPLLGKVSNSHNNELQHG